MQDLVIMKDKQAVTTSLQVAEGFKKQHKHVIEAMEAKGHHFIYELLKENGVLPLIERSEADGTLKEIRYPKVEKVTKNRSHNN